MEYRNRIIPINTITPNTEPHLNLYYIILYYINRKTTNCHYEYHNTGYRALLEILKSRFPYLDQKRLKSYGLILLGFQMYQSHGRGRMRAYSIIEYDASWRACHNRWGVLTWNIRPANKYYFAILCEYLHKFMTPQNDRSFHHLVALISYYKFRPDFWNISLWNNGVVDFFFFFSHTQLLIY